MANSWRERLEGGKSAHLETLDKPFGGAPRGAIMLVATPRLVDQFINGLESGSCLTVSEMRNRLAASQGADIACPISTSIFARIAAEVALEELAAGKPEAEVTPFWRAIEPASPLAKKLTCGPAFIVAQRAKEARHD